MFPEPFREAIFTIIAIMLVIGILAIVIGRCLDEPPATREARRRLREAEEQAAKQRFEDEVQAEMIRLHKAEKAQGRTP
jgi:hypothetical protein